MNRLKPEKQKQIIACLVEGNSIRATCRMTGAAKGTVLKLLADVGKACSDYQDRVFKNLECSRIQCDEIWSFCTMKEKNVPPEKKGQIGYGDVYTFTALCEDSKLVPSWYVSKRTLTAAIYFMDDLAKRMKHRIQITTDGHKAYIEAVEHAFGSEVDFSQLVKIYGNEPEGEKRYSPAKYVSAKKEKIQGNPDMKKTSTSYVERQNLTMRMSMRRFTRLTNAFSKKAENIAHAVSLHFMYYNFCRIHQSLQCSPAMAAGVTGTLWEIEDIIKLLK
ncbi:MAG: IS1 family transposase [Nitrospirota bacterium]